MNHGREGVRLGKMFLGFIKDALQKRAYSWRESLIAQRLLYNGGLPLRKAERMVSTSECLCHLVDYTYNRNRVPASVQWALDIQIISMSPLAREPVLVAQVGGADWLSMTFAVPCSETGTIEKSTADEYEKLADEQFRSLRPGQELT
jgi:hypothetical protein